MHIYMVLNQIEYIKYKTPPTNKIPTKSLSLNIYQINQNLMLEKKELRIKSVSSHRMLEAES